VLFNNPIQQINELFRHSDDAAPPPEWARSRQSEVSHRALLVALCRSQDDLERLQDCPGQAIRPSQLRACRERGDLRIASGLVGATAAAARRVRLGGSAAEDTIVVQHTPDDELVRTGRPQWPEEITPDRDLLRKHFDTALADLATHRGVEPKYSEYERQTQDCVFEAGVRAIRDGAIDILWETSPFCAWTEEHPFHDLPEMYVVHTGPGSGKSTAAKALMAALVRATEGASYPVGCALLVHHVETIASAYAELSALLPGRVGLWSKEHDFERGQRQPRFSPEDLKQYPLIIVTHAFYQGPRGDLARSYRSDRLRSFRPGRDPNSIPRVLTFVDEKINEVETYSVTHGDVAQVQGRVQRNEHHVDELDTATEQLVEFVINKRHGPDLETPSQDPDGWQVADRLLWFTTDEAARHQRSQSARWDRLDFEGVFGLGRAIARRRAFIARSANGKRGATFVGYQENRPEAFGMILLDATADIDGVNELCSWRIPVEGPAERFDNLDIVHIPSIVKGTFKKWWDENRCNQIDYVAYVRNTILHNVERGQRALVVCMKDIVCCSDLDGWSKYVGCFADRDTTDYVWNLDDRRIAVTWWGGYGIGANDWLDADVVLLFEDYHLPRHVLIAMVQGLQDYRATKGPLATLAALQERRHPEVDLLGDGQVLRWLKQMALRGRARDFDAHGTCGRQRLVVTGDLTRIIANLDRVFPGAQRPSTSEPHKHGTLMEKLSAVLVNAADAETLSSEEVGTLIGAEWRKVSGDLVKHPRFEAVVAKAGFRYVPGKGRRRSRFDRIEPPSAPIARIEAPGVPHRSAGK
jgi:hypothetical protein